MYWRGPWALVAGLVVMLVSGPLEAARSPAMGEVPAPPAAAADPFPIPAALGPNVAFWRKVYAMWGLGQVALHDAEHTDLVYQVVDLPAPVGESMTRAQRDFVKSRMHRLQRRLKHIAESAGHAQKLNSEDRALMRHIIDAADKTALRDASERVRSQRGLRERFRRGLELSGRYDRIFRAVFREAGLPEDLAYLPHVESSFHNQARSSAGAAGMWQFTRLTGKRYMRVDRTIDERLDPVVSAQAAARYLRHAHDVLGSWPLAVTSYNHGVAGMARAKEQHGEDLGMIVREYDGPSFGFASRNFYAEFLAARELARDHSRRFHKTLSKEPALVLDRVLLKRASSTAALARRYGLRMDRLAACNPSWRDAAARGAARLAAGTAVWLPAGTLRRLGATKAAVAIAATRVVPSQMSREPKPRVRRAAVHVVKRGDTLYDIAKWNHTSVRRLLALNGLGTADSRKLRPGRKLRLPGRASAAAARKIHVVRKGDCASVIAAEHGVKVSELLAVNQLPRDAVLHPGQRLGIPARH